MKRVYELEVYAEGMPVAQTSPDKSGSDLVWYDFDKWNKKVQNTVGHQIIRASDSPDKSG